MKRLQRLDLSGNIHLKQIDSDAFIGLGALTELDLSRNRLIKLPAGLFKNCIQLTTLDLSYTSITSLPLTTANTDLQYLNIRGTKTLKRFPDVDFPNLTTAHLYYPSHCCRVQLVWSGYQHFPCGIEDFYRSVIYSKTCTFSLCEHVFEEMWLRVVAWFVTVVVLCGNITVILLIIFGEAKIDNTRCLFLNLAAAGLCLGIYLLSLCIVDSTTRDDCYKVTQSWQSSHGAKFVGFLAVTSTEMTFYTLMLIMVDWYLAIRYSIDGGFRMTSKHLTVLVVSGWLLAVVLAVLPAAGILSSYTKFVLALPFDIEKQYDQAYVSFLLVLNGASVLVALVFYIKACCAVRKMQLFDKNETRIAYRMSLLVLVDAACWLPMAVLGLAATFARVYPVDKSTAKILTILVLPLVSCTSLVLFALVTRNFKENVIFMLRRLPEKVNDISRWRTGSASLQHSVTAANDTETTL